MSGAAPRSPLRAAIGLPAAIGSTAAIGRITELVRIAAIDSTAAIGRIAAIGLAIACGHGGRAAPPSPAREGLSIALYDHGNGGGFGVIDDRRWLEVAGDALVIDHLEPGAALSSLVIEPLAGGALDVGACLRARLSAAPEPGLATGSGSGRIPAAGSLESVAPELRCAVHAAPGRYLVRVLYVSPRLGYRAQHDIAMTAPDRATVVSRFAIATPAWHARAEVTLFDGLPGSEQPPREVARGAIVLDGGAAVVAAPPRDVAAQLRWIYRGVTRGGDDGDVPRAAQSAVWVWLELDGLTLAPGPVRAHVELAGEAIRDIDVPAAGRRQAAAVLRLPLWIDDQLRGTRDHWLGSPADQIVTDKLVVSVANTGATTRDVWIEETLNPAQRRTIVRAWPSEPAILKNRLRMKLTVPGGKIERARFEIAYEL